LKAQEKLGSALERIIKVAGPGMGVV